MDKNTITFLTDGNWSAPSILQNRLKYADGWPEMELTIK